MAQKGIDMAIDEPRTELAAFVNNKLKSGIPVTVLNLIFENIITELRGITASIKSREDELYLEQLQAEEEQVEFKEEPKPSEGK